MIRNIDESHIFGIFEGINKFAQTNYTITKNLMMK